MRTHARTMLLASILAPALASAAGAQPASPSQPAAEFATLPIRRVVLYKHGLGYFERQGDVEGDASVQIRFGHDEMSDVLKSLTVLDLGGGSVEAIAYDSQKPAEMALAEFAFDLRKPDAQKELLEHLRGAEVDAEFAGRGKVTGSVLGFDSRTERVDGVEVKSLRLSLLTDDGKIVASALDDLRSLVFRDPALAAQLARYLSLLRTTHRRGEKTLDLVCHGAGARPIFAAYTVEQPVWKATYRLVVAGEKSPFLQGWAVVDNTSNEDWTDVRLSLVAGLPVSFRLDLYTPQYRDRPWLQVQETASVAFRHDADDSRVDEARKALSELGYVGGEKARAPIAGAAGADKAMADAFRSVEAESLTREIGDLLEYEIDHPVTILRNRSALLPIVAGEVEGKKVALYSERARAGNPLSAVRVKNTTGLSLESGPLTVLEGETYAGEAWLDSLKPAETRYVTYAVDLGVKATTKLDTKSERAFKVAFLRGAMITTSWRLETKTYTFDNKNPQPRTVVVEHARRAGLELREPKEPLESELGLYRFQVDLGASETKALAVREAQPVEQGFSVSDVDADRLTILVREGVINDEAKAFLEDVIARKGAIAKLAAELGTREADLKAIDQDEARLRQNLQVLGDSPEEKDLLRVYVDRLAQNETKVKALKSQQDALRQQRAAAQAELEQRIQDFALTYTLG